MQDYILCADNYMKTSRYLKYIKLSAYVILIFNYIDFIEAAIVIRSI